MMRLFPCLVLAAVLPSAAIARSPFVLAHATAESSPVEEPPAGDAANPPKTYDSTRAKKKPDVLTLDGAIRHALTHSPRLKASQASVAASRGGRRQAGVLPNPAVGYGKQNFNASGGYKVVSPGQSVYEVSQLIEVGGKRSARIDIADKGVQIAGLERQATTLDLIRDVTIAFAEAVAAEENVRLAAEQKALAEDVLHSVSVRVDAAASPLIQKRRAEVERASASVALDNAKREREISFVALAALLDEDDPSFKLDTKAFFALPGKTVSADPERLKANPDLAKLGTALEQSRARLDLERANAVPDPTLSAGLVRIPSANGNALMVGVALPIPVLNANRGNIEKARSEVTQTEEGNRYAARSLSADLARAEQQMRSAHALAKTLSAEILPGAQKAFALAREGYGLGRFAYIEVLDAQRSLFGARQQYVAALKAYHTARAVTERLTATHLPKSTTEESNDE